MNHLLIQRIFNNSLIQVGVICFVWILCELLVSWKHIPFPAGILGLSIILLLLSTQCISLNKLKGGADLLLKDMLLFFIPAVLAVLEHHEFLGILGLKILFVIVLSTVAVMLVTALVVEYCYYWNNWNSPHVKSSTQ